MSENTKTNEEHLKSLEGEDLVEFIYIHKKQLASMKRIRAFMEKTVELTNKEGEKVI